MPDVNTTENIRAWLRSCPAVKVGNRFSVDYLGANPTEYSIFVSPSPLTFKTDILGNVNFNATQDLNFIIANREAYGSDVLQNLANLGFFDDVIAWICEQNKTKNFPTIREGTVISIMPSLTQYLFEAGTDSGRYQIQCKLTYRRYA
ncbi:MAG: hypothetical protein VB064_12855 [Oscillospiraceae bacterium]|nr:hypothetical protein [Oscillospiraceae bacterium]